MSDMVKQAAASKPGQYTESCLSPSTSGAGNLEVEEEALYELENSQGKQLPLQELSLVSAMLKLINHNTKHEHLNGNKPTDFSAQKENIPESSTSVHSIFTLVSSSSSQTDQQTVNSSCQAPDNSSQKQNIPERYSQHQLTIISLLTHILSKYFSSSQSSNGETTQDDVAAAQQTNDIESNGTMLVV